MDQFNCLSFDCSGTLIDWETGIASALEGIIASHQVSIDRESLLELYGSTEAEVESGAYIPYREVLREALRRIGRALSFEPSRADLERFSSSVMHWPAFQDSSDALGKLATKYQLIILSNIDDDLFQYSQASLGLDFSKVFTAETIGSYKPSRRNFEYLVEHAGVAKNKILHVAQSLYHDIIPAKEIGLSTVWVNRRHGLEGSGATPPAEALPDLTVPDLRSLAALMSRPPSGGSASH